jgi:amidase
MPRRFLFGATGFLAAVTPLLATDNHSHNHDSHHDVDVGIDALVMSQVLTDPYAYDFPRLNTDGADLFPMRPCKGHQLLEASIDDLQELLSAGELTSVDLLQCYLERIYQTDSYLKYVTLPHLGIDIQTRCSTQRNL